MTQIDLHSHTVASDGSLTASELVGLAVANGVRILAITDHDSTDGIQEALKAQEWYGNIEVIAGCELSADIDGSEVHILGYFDPEVLCNSEFQAILGELRTDRIRRAKGMIDILKRCGVSVGWNEVSDQARGSNIGRLHIAQVMVRRGYVSSIDEAFERYLGRNAPAYVERNVLTPESAIRWIRRAGGAPVLAHPMYLRTFGGSATLRDMVGKLTHAGLAGVEAYHPSHALGDTEMLCRLAADLGLGVTGGSDFHQLEDDQYQLTPGCCGAPNETALAFIRRERPEVRTATVGNA